MYLKKVLSRIFIVATSYCVASSCYAGVLEDATLSVLRNYQPGTSALGAMKVQDVKVDSKTKTIDIKCNENVAYLPLTAQRLAQLKSDLLARFGNDYKKYTVNITAGDKSLDQLTLFSPKKHLAPTEKFRFVTDREAQPAPNGLDGANIALWQSHGWYFEPKLNRWEWQRARIFQTVEDLYTQSYVMPFLMPMLRNAGAYVMSPRERDINRTEIIVDGDNLDGATPGYNEHSGLEKWRNSSTPGFGWNGEKLVNGQHPFADGTSRVVKTVAMGSRTEASTATWSASFPTDGDYAVYVSYSPQPNAAPDAQYTVRTANGDRHFTVNQRMGAGTWIYLGHFPFKAGQHDVVTLGNYSKTPGSVVSADAVKIGGGMGVVSRIVKEPKDSIDYKYVSSGYPKFVEGARYFLQWAGAPDSVFTPSDYVNDYTDDYRSRGLWVNWLAGGSSQLPGRKGLNIPVDLSFAWHTDAGTFKNDSIVGTLGIYCTSGDTLGNGSSRGTSRDLTDLIMTNITDDIRRDYEPKWTRRGMWDKSYYEARVPEVPASLLELLSHQNFADMKYGLDPTFRFTVSRAVYKGMLKFLAQRDGRPYTVQPLPVRCFAINPTAPRTYTLTWAERVDSVEPTAKPTYYIIEQRVGNANGFKFLAKSFKPEYQVKVTDNEIHSYRIIAANDGGVSFPSEVLALCAAGEGAPVQVVNGFTRISGPDTFEFSKDFAGFYDERDHGVPYVNDISFIGSQFEFRRDIPWMDDDAAGFGASRSNYEDKVIAGNTFDFVYTHGQAIAAAGHPFYSSSVEAYMAQPVGAADAPVVDLILGKQKEIKRGRGVYGTYYKTFPSELQSKIATATAAGTSFLVTGSFIATDLWDNPNSSKETAEADKKFASEVLGYKWRVGQASVTGEVYEVDSRFKQFDGGWFAFSNTLNDECYAVESPDSFYAADPNTGATIMRYSENNLVAGTACRMNGYRTVMLGFPFETIAGSDQRDTLMNQILNFLLSK